MKQLKDNENLSDISYKEINDFLELIYSENPKIDDVFLLSKYCVNLILKKISLKSDINYI